MLGVVVGTNAFIKFIWIYTQRWLIEYSESNQIFSYSVLDTINFFIHEQDIPFIVLKFRERWIIIKNWIILTSANAYGIM